MIGSDPCRACATARWHPNERVVHHLHMIGLSLRAAKLLSHSSVLTTSQEPHMYETIVMLGYS